jgi:hypothetical protein
MIWPNFRPETRKKKKKKSAEHPLKQSFRFSSDPRISANLHLKKSDFTYKKARIYSKKVRNIGRSAPIFAFSHRFYSYFYSRQQEYPKNISQIIRVVAKNANFLWQIIIKKIERF